MTNVRIVPCALSEALNAGVALTKVAADSGKGLTANHREDGKSDTVAPLCRIDTLDEVEYYKNGGILACALRDLIKRAA